MRDIIHDHGSAKPKTSVSGALIAIDLKRNAVTDDTRLRFLGRRYRYISIIGGTTSARDIAQLRVEDIKGRVLPIIISYQVRCEHGNERAAVSALIDNGDIPQDAIQDFIQNSLERHLKKWAIDFIDDYEGGRQAFIEAFDSSRAELSRFLKEKAKAAVGLDLTLELGADGEAALDTIEISEVTVSVLPADADETLKFRVSANLELVDGERIKALICSREDKDFEDIIQRLVKDSLRRYSLDELYFSRDDIVVPQLKRDINKALIAEGRRLGNLQVLPDDLSDTPEPFLEIDMPLAIPLREAPAKVSVTHRMHLKINSIANFRRRNIAAADLKAWVGKQLEAVSREVLFNKSFADLVGDFNQDEARIRHMISDVMSSAGYRIQMYMILPELEPIRLQRDGFEFTINEDLRTKDLRVHAGVDISVRGHIPDLTHPAIKRRLKPPRETVGNGSEQKSLEDELRQAATNAASWAISSLKPEMFYRYFDVPYTKEPKSGVETGSPDDQPPVVAEGELREGYSVEALLRRNIEEVLRKDFAADDIEVLPRIDQNDLTRRIVQLCQGHHAVEIKVLPLANAGDAHPVFFDLNLKITGIAKDGWTTFQSNAGFADRSESGEIDVHREINEIGEIVKNAVRQRLELAPAAALQYRNIETQRKVERLIEHYVKERIESVFGLNAEVISVHRRPTEEEAYRQRARGMAVNTSEKEDTHRRKLSQSGRASEREKLEELKTQIAKLRDGRTELVLSNGGDDEIEAVNRSIKSLEKEINRLTQGSPLPAPVDGQTSAEDFDFDSLWDIPPGGPSETTQETKNTPLPPADD